MHRDRFMGLAHRMLNLIDTESTDLAPASFQQPTDAYTSTEIFSRERLAIFARTPMFIGMSNEIPKPGAYFTRDIVDTPLLAVRHKDGSVRLFLNACRHRGAKVAVDRCGSAPRLVCPFHAWTYDLDGRLVGVPEPEGFDDMDRATYGLVQLPVAEKYGMIFGCATPGVEIDIDELLGGLGPELAEWGFDKFSIFSDPHVHDVKANWKYTWDTFNENYHFAFLHRNTLGDYLVSRRQAYDVYGRNVRMISALKTIEEMRKLPEDQWRPEEHLSIQYRLFPSVNFSVYPGYMAVFWILPGKSPSHTNAYHITYVPKQPETEEELARANRAVTIGCNDVLENEDFWAAGLAEMTMRAPAAPTHYLLGRNEPALQHFNRLFDELVRGDDPSGVQPGQDVPRRLAAV